VDGTVFVGSWDGNVYALDADDGTEQWAFQTGNAVSNSPTVVDGTVFVGSGDGNVYALEAGVSGSSEGSRVMLGTLGHHGDWRYAGQNIDRQTATDPTTTDPTATEPPTTGPATTDPTATEPPTTDPTTTGSVTTTDPSDSGLQDTPEETSATDGSGGLPGFGIAAGIVGIGTGLGLKQYLEDDVEE